MLNRIGRLVAAVIAAVLTLLAAPVTEAIAVTPAESLSTYAYDGHHHLTLLTGVGTERGPPAVRHLLTTHDALNPRSPSAPACSGERPSQAVATYDDSAWLVKGARATPTTDGRVEVPSGCPVDFERWRVAAKTETELVQRWMSRAELDATIDTGLVRGGRDGTHYVTDFANHDALRARQGLALPQTGEVRVQLEVPRGTFSAPKPVEPDYFMPGGGMERTATGSVPCRVVCVWG